MDQTLDRPTSATFEDDRLIYGVAPDAPIHPFAGIARPSLDELLDRTAKWYETGCAGGEVDLVLVQFVQAQATLRQTAALERIAERLERPNWLVRLWQFLIWEPEGN